MSVDTDYSVLRHMLSEHRPRGWAIEFGVYTGYSLALIADHMPVIGLDSFDGLPEDWREGFPKGKFATHQDDLHGRVPHSPLNAMIVKGMFHESLTLLRGRGLPWFGLVHIDCDLYSSTVTALHGIVEFIGTGTIVVFDEYHGYPGHEEHEMKAWQEFCHEYTITSEMIASGPEEAAFYITGMGASQ